MATTRLEEATVETAGGVRRPASRQGYPGHLAASFRHTFITLRRRRWGILPILIAFLPPIIPLAIAFFDAAPTVAPGADVFVQLSEKLYLKAIAPLLALFFGCVLIGEDIESQTLHYILTRPAPRSAWVIGRFLAYAVFVGAVIVLSLGLAFGACTALGRFPVSEGNLRLLAHYAGVQVAAVAAYGALSMYLGAAFKRPVVYGVLLLFLWQRIAMNMPGLADFLTLEKYLVAILPPLATQRGNPVMQTAIAEFQKTEYLVGAGKASVVLVVATVVFVALTALVVRRREFTPARAAGS